MNVSTHLKVNLEHGKSRCLILLARNWVASQIPDLAELAILFLLEAGEVALTLLVVEGVALHRQLVHDRVYLLLLLLEET